MQSACDRADHAITVTGCSNGRGHLACTFHPIHHAFHDFHHMHGGASRCVCGILSHLLDSVVLRACLLFCSHMSYSLSMCAARCVPHWGVLSGANRPCTEHGVRKNPRMVRAQREKHALRVVGEVCWSTCGSGYGVCGSEPRRRGGGDHEKTRRPRGGGNSCAHTEPRTRRGALAALSTLGETYIVRALPRPRRSSKALWFGGNVEAKGLVGGLTPKPTHRRTFGLARSAEACSREGSVL